MKSMDLVPGRVRQAPLERISAREKRNVTVEGERAMRRDERDKKQLRVYR